MKRTLMPHVERAHNTTSDGYNNKSVGGWISESREGPSIAAPPRHRTSSCLFEGCKGGARRHWMRRMTNRPRMLRGVNSLVLGRMQHERMLQMHKDK